MPSDEALCTPFVSALAASASPSAPPSVRASQRGCHDVSLAATAPHMNGDPTVTAVEFDVRCMPLGVWGAGHPPGPWVPVSSAHVALLAPAGGGGHAAAAAGTSPSKRGGGDIGKAGVGAGAGAGAGAAGAGAAGAGAGAGGREEGGATALPSVTQPVWQYSVGGLEPGAAYEVRGERICLTRSGLRRPPVPDRVGLHAPYAVFLPPVACAYSEGRQCGRGGPKCVLECGPDSVYVPLERSITLTVPHPLVVVMA